MPRFKQDHPKQIPNLMQNFCVMTSHLPNQLPHMTSQLNETSLSGKLEQKNKNKLKSVIKISLEYFPVIELKKKHLSLLDGVIHIF